MKIGLDVTILHIAQAGVFYYHYNLARALLALEPAAHDYVLVDYEPNHGNWHRPAELDTLGAPHARTLHLGGLRHRRLSRLAVMQRPPLEPLARVVDGVLLYPWGKAAEAVMRRQLDRHLADLDVFHTSDVLTYAPPGVKNVATIHDLTPLLFPELHTRETREIHSAKLNAAAERADAIIAVSESTRRDAVALLGLDPARVFTVHEGVDQAFRPLRNDEIRPVLARHGLEPGGYLLHVGTIEPRKNLVRLVEAYARLRRDVRPPAPSLALAGATGWLFREVFDRVKALGLHDHVRFLGQVSTAELPALFNGARLFVFPSLYEGFGLPVLEAMACGAPVITSNVSSLPELTDGAAVLVDPADSVGLAEAMGRLLEDAAERERLRAAGLTRAAGFSWEKAAWETVQLYQRIVD
jgi:glycosyltransferase involved in cell wall biosynthesis